MKIRFRLENIKQLLSYISGLTNKQKRAFHILLENVSESNSNSQSMPSLVNGTSKQWGEYLGHQKPFLDQLTSKAGQLVPISEYHLLAQDRQSIDLARRIDQGTGYWSLIRKMLSQNPFLEVLIASRITADRYSSSRDVYNQLVDALANLAKPAITVSDQSKYLAVIEYRMIILARQFNFTWLDASLVDHVINEVHRCFYQDHAKVLNNTRSTQGQSLPSFAGFKVWNKVGSALCKIIKDALLNQNYVWLKQFARYVDLDFSKASSADQFISRLRSSSVTLIGLRLALTSHDLNQLTHDPDAESAYHLAKHYSCPIHRIFHDLDTLNSANKSVKLTDIVDVVKWMPGLRDHSVVQRITDYAEQVRHDYQNRSDYKSREAFDSLINNHSYESSLFAAVIHRVIDSDDTSEWRGLINFVRVELKKSDNLQTFISRLSDHMNKFNGRITRVVNYYLALTLRFHDDYEINAIYNTIHNHPDVSGVILDNLSSLNKWNKSTNLIQIARKIQGSKLNLIRITRTVAVSALRMANTDGRLYYLSKRDDAHQIFAELINRTDYVSSLFTLVVDRLISPQTSLKWRRSIKFIEFDFDRSQTFLKFIKRFSRLIFGTHGPILDLANYLTRLMVKYPDDQLNRLYESLYENRSIVNQILENLIYLKAGKKHLQLTRIVREINDLDLNSVKPVHSLLVTVSQMISLNYRHDNSKDAHHYVNHPEGESKRYSEQLQNQDVSGHLLSNMDQLINKLNDEINRS